MRGGKKITFSFDLNPGGKKETVLAHRGWRMLGEMKKVIQNSKKHPLSLRAAQCCIWSHVNMLSGRSHYCHYFFSVNNHLLLFYE